MKYTFTVLLFLLVISINSTEAQFAIGAGIAYTSNTNDVGIQLKTQFSFAKRWRIEGSINGYSTNSNQNVYADANINGNYIFTETETVELHALLGYNVFFGKYSTTGIVPPSPGLLAQGINIGAGMQYEFNSSLNGYFDGVFTFTDYGIVNLNNRFLFTLGVIYEFNSNQSN